MIKKFALFIFIFFLPTSLFCLTLENIDKWEEPLKEYFSKEKDVFTYKYFYSYLYIAQRDAYCCNRDIKSLDPLTARIVALLLPKFTTFPSLETDSESEAVAECIFQMIKRRIQNERDNRSTFHSPRPLPPKIQRIGHLIPWERELPCTPPPSFDLNHQMTLLRKERESLGEKEFSLLAAWSGRNEEHLEWRIMANQYMTENAVSLDTVLNVRALLMMAQYDAYLASFKGKVTYWIPRPFQIDPSIHLLAHPPHSPSYPSTHAAVAGAASVILSAFFPCAGWTQIAQDSAHTRVWAGVHTPQDIEAGFALGQEVGKNILYMKYQGH